MKRLNEMSNFDKNNLSSKLESEFRRALKDEDFKKIISSIDLPYDELMKYTSKLELCAKESHNCEKCKSLDECVNEIKGFKFTNMLVDGRLIFDYVACRYKQEELSSKEKNVHLFDISKDIMNARMKDIYVNDKNRKEVIIWIKNFVKGYDPKNPTKGLFLHGNFGCGKTYLIVAGLNELSKFDIVSAVIHWPEFLRDLKASFDDDFKEKFNFIKRVPILLIDDIGAENLTSWARDEILASILQYRMESHLTTFFTSNLNLEELEQHLSITRGKVDSLKASRIIERIKKLTEDIEMNASNLR